PDQKKPCSIRDRDHEQEHRGPPENNDRWSQRTDGRIEEWAHLDHHRIPFAAAIDQRLQSGTKLSRFNPVAKANHSAEPRIVGFLTRWWPDEIADVSAMRKIESGGRDTDYPRRNRIRQPKSLTDDLGIGTEDGCPDPMANDDGEVRFRFGCHGCIAEVGHRAEHGEEIAGH